MESAAAGGTAIISQQYLNGSLFKSQNGQIWTPSQFEDLKFTLYKASFVTTPATVYLSNPDLIASASLPNDPIDTLPRKLKVPVNTTPTTSYRVISSSPLDQVLQTPRECVVI